MDVRAKLEILADAAKYDASCASGGSNAQRGDEGLGSTQKMGICHSFTPDGRCVSLLKILLTNYCIFDCQYCVNRISSDVRRARFSVEEIVSLTLEFYRRNYVEGLFLSSGIIQTPDYTMEQLVEVARQLRRHHRFRGYIHLKTIPGADPRLVEQAGLLADRLSVNIELPTELDLVQLAPEKKRAEIEQTMAEICTRSKRAKEEQERLAHAPHFAPAGQSTQLIIGATPTADRAILETSSTLYEQHRLRRVYYSAFSPIPHADERLPSQEPPLIREHRLYQADWLIRFYGFEASELTTPEQPNLSLDLDPKQAWALAHREYFPVDVNSDDRERLLRVPGVGARNVDRILAARKHCRLTTADLKRLRVAWRRAQPFLITADHHPARLLDRQTLEAAPAPARQLQLFDRAVSAVSGEF
jgi:putative DNA modification/repair radical SAM protein